MSNEVTFSYKESRVPEKEIVRLTGALEPVRKKLMHATKKKYTQPEGAINLCADKELHTQIHKLAHTIKRQQPALLVVIGIGGSNVGTMAIQQFIQGKLHNEKRSSLKVLYADTADSDELAEIKESMRDHIRNNQSVILNVVSKSGTTTETIANFEVLLEILKKNNPTYKEQVVVTTDKDTPLYHCARREGFYFLEIPKKIGGRYSVLSAVGLFPLALAGIDIDQLLEGARVMRARCLAQKKNPAKESAAIRYWHAHHGQAIQDLFLFGNDFKSFGKWSRQLVAESLGKGCDKTGRVCIGITPTYSIGSTDMHSIAQLYLGGPFDKLTTFVRVKKNRTNLSTPYYPSFNTMVQDIQSKPLSAIMHALYQGVTNTFAQKKRPFMEIGVPNKTEHAMGQLIQFHMMEVMYLAELLHVNAFDQPDIESYKRETRRLLKQA